MGVIATTCLKFAFVFIVSAFTDVIGHDLGTVDVSVPFVEIKVMQLRHVTWKPKIVNTRGQILRNVSKRTTKETLRHTGLIIQRGTDRAEENF